MYEYRDVADHGRIERLSYQYMTPEGEVSKYVNVYLPYDYKEENNYEVLYLMHGGGGNADAWLDASGIKNMLDRMIEEGRIRPVIAVFASYYPGAPKKDRHMDRDYDRNLTRAFARELREAVIPLVEGKYSTFAQTTSLEDLQASRDHRAFTGFSMGGCTTWYVFTEAMDLFRTFLPLSGDCWLLEVQGGQKRPEETARALKMAVESQQMGKEDFTLLCATGTEDIAYEAMKAQIAAMREIPELFDDGPGGNFCFYVEEGQRHSYDAVNRYLEVLLPRIFAGR